MLKIKSPNYQFCPFCGQKLKVKTEEKKERKFCSLCNWTYYPTVFMGAVGVLHKNDKVLLVKRNRDPFKGTWMFPAGFIEYGEDPEEALKREFKEETGLRVKSINFLNLFQSEDDYRSPGAYIFFYKVTVYKGKIKNDKEENQDIGWFDIKNLPKIGWESHRQVLKLLCETWI